MSFTFVVVFNLCNTNWKLKFIIGAGDSEWIDIVIGWVVLTATLGMCVEPTTLTTNTLTVHNQMTHLTKSLLGFMIMTVVRLAGLLTSFPYM